MDGAGVVDGLVLFVQPDDAFEGFIFLGGFLGSMGRGKEEGFFGILAELVNQAPEAAWGISESSGHGITGEFFNEIGSKSLILTMSGVLGC